MNPRLLILLASLSAVLFAQNGNRGPQMPRVDETGFVSIFDGQSLKGWDGDPNFWRVESGVIIGETTKERQPKQNTFLIWRGGSTGNF